LFDEEQQQIPENQRENQEEEQATVILKKYQGLFKSNKDVFIPPVGSAYYQTYLDQLIEIDNET